VNFMASWRESCWRVSGAIGAEAASLPFESDHGRQPPAGKLHQTKVVTIPDLPHNDVSRVRRQTP
jgi:hypothetical protein